MRDVEQSRTSSRRASMWISFWGPLPAGLAACLTGWLGFVAVHASHSEDVGPTAAALADAGAFLFFGILGLLGASLAVVFWVGDFAIGLPAGLWVAVGGFFTAVGAPAAVDGIG